MPTLELIEDDRPFLINNNNNNSPLNNKKDFDELTQEEQNALLDQISSVVANDPKAFERLATMFLGQVTKQDFNTVNIQPQAGYVCKTRVISSSKNTKYKVGTIVYINICYATAIPAPPIVTEKEIQKALEGEPNASYKVPLSMGQERFEKDCLIMDACINTQPYLRSEKDLDFRLYILELSMEYVEEIVSVNLSREFTMPTSIKSMGGNIPARILRLPKPSLITAVKNEVNSTSKKPVEWKLQPNITMDKKNELLHIVIPMPDKVSFSLSLY